MEYKELQGLNKLSKQVYENNKAKGFWEEDRLNSTLLMLCVSELGEACEADRKGRFANMSAFQSDIANGSDFADSFKANVKDTFEDELSDCVIRILDMCGARGIDLESHIRYKLMYNETRPYKHGKQY